MDPKNGTLALAPEEPSKADGDSFALTLERLASNPNASIETIERMMALWERSQAKKAEAIFNEAMSAAQKEMRPVAADASNPQTKSRYASYKALDDALRPIYSKYGFALSFNTGEAPLPDYVRVLCDVTLGAHSKPYKIDMPSDGKGAKGGDVMTKTHATGAAMSYGMRYLLKMIWNVAVGEDDTDGNRPVERSPSQAPEPAGYQSWKDDMTAVADEGMAAFAKAWAASKDEHRVYSVKYDSAWGKATKAKAQAVKS